MREGEKAFKDRCMPYVGRLYDLLNANDLWVADNHTLDVQSINGDGKMHRLHYTTFLDMKSGAVVGGNITDNPCAASTILALRNGILKFGIPKAVLFDNGSEFLTYDVGGRGHRTRKNSPDTPPTILQYLGIEMHNALVRNAKAKPIERFYGTLKNQFSREFTGFCAHLAIKKSSAMAYLRIFTARSCGIIALKKRYLILTKKSMSDTTLRTFLVLGFTTKAPINASAHGHSRTS